MTDHKPTRRDIMRPVQLLGLAFGAALFGGIVTLVAMGFFQQRVEGQAARALVVAGIVAGVSFIAVLLVVSLLLLAVDPADVTKTIDRPVLYDAGADGPAVAEAGHEATDAADPRSRDAERGPGDASGNAAGTTPPAA